MNLKDKHIFQKFAWFIMNNPGKMIYYINEEGYGRLPIGASVNQINDVVADNMFDKGFITGVADLMEENQRHLNAIGLDVIAVVVSAIGQTISNVYWTARMSIFGQQQTLKAGMYSREQEERMEKHAISDAKKRMSIMLGATQADMVLRRDAQIESDKRKETLTIFGMFGVGAILVAIIVMKMKKK